MTETNAERLKRIKVGREFKELNLCNAPKLGFEWPFEEIHKSNFDFLIEQAERAQELEGKSNGDGLLTLEEQLDHAKEEIVGYRQELYLRKCTSVSMDSIERFTNQIKDENKRLREAIKQALDKHKWNNEESAVILEKALEELK